MLDLLKLLIACKRCGKYANDEHSTWSFLDEWNDRVRKTPDRPFLELAHNNNNGNNNNEEYGSLTFRETDELSDKLARVWLRLLNLKKKDQDKGAPPSSPSPTMRTSPVRVAVMLPSSPLYVANFLGLVKAGACAGLLNTNLRGLPLAQAVRTALSNDDGEHDDGDFPRLLLIQEGALLERLRDKDVRDAIRDLGVRVVVKRASSYDPASCDVTFPDELRHDDLCDVTTLDDLLRDDTQSPLRPLHTPRWDSTFFYVFTSGTTGGKAKASIIRHIRYLLSGYTVAITARLDDRDRVYCALPLYHSAGAMIGVCGCVLAGSCLVIRPKFSASNFARDLCVHECTVLQYIGEFARYALSADPDAASETKLRQLARQHGDNPWWWPLSWWLNRTRGNTGWKGVRVATGNGMRPEVWEPFQARFGIREIVEFYASTEGNANMINNCGKVGSIGCIPNFVKPLYPICLVKCDPLTGDILRDPKTKLAMTCGANEPGQLLGLIRKDNTKPNGKIDPARMFEGYTDTQASQKKIVCHVTRRNDEWFATGDLLRRDRFGFYFWVDRIGDTFRWKGENVSTCEVAGAVMGSGGGEDGGEQIFDVNVYGVEIPGYPGRAGMARISLARGVEAADLDLSLLYTKLQSQLAQYAQPVFLRFAKPELEDDNNNEGGGGHSTSTFKQMKGQLRDQGFDPSKCDGEVVLIRDDAKKTFRRLTEELYKDVCNSKVRL